jgi:hypothetical protein
MCFSRAHIIWSKRLGQKVVGQITNDETEEKTNEASSLFLHNMSRSY